MHRATNTAVTSVLVVMLAGLGSASAHGFSDGRSGTQRSMHDSASYSQTILADHPTMYWRLGDRSGKTAFDASGNGNDAIYVNRPHLGNPGAIVGDADTAVHFNGYRQFARWRSDSSYAGSFTVEAWATAIY